MRVPPSPPPGLRPVDPREWTRIWRRVIAAPSVKVVGYACADWADYKTGTEIRPGVALLMLACGIKSDTTVRNALKQMRGQGLIWRYYEARTSGIEGDSDIHRLTFPDDISAIPMYSPDWDPPALAPAENMATTGTHYRWYAADRVVYHRYSLPVVRVIHR